MGRYGATDAQQKEAGVRWRADAAKMAALRR